MKVKIIRILILLLFFNSYGQPKEEISLPEGGIDKFDFNKKHYTIHYTKDQKMFFNNDRLRFWDQIASSILSEERQPKMNAVSDIIIYADKDLTYAFIERIRHEIGKVWNGYLHFKSDSYKTPNCLTFYINGSGMRTKKYDIVDWYYGPKIIYMTKEFTGEDKTPELEGWVWPVPAVWQHNFSGDFFKKYIDGINQFLNNESYKALIIKSETTYLCNKKLLEFKDEKLIEHLVDENDLLFIKTEVGLSFKAYFKAITNIQKKRKLHEEHDVLRKPFIIEVPYIFEEELLEKGIKLFD